MINKIIKKTMARITPTFALPTISFIALITMFSLFCNEISMVISFETPAATVIESSAFFQELKPILHLRSSPSDNFKLDFLVEKGLLATQMTVPFSSSL